MHSSVKAVVELGKIAVPLLDIKADTLKIVCGNKTVFISLFVNRNKV
jgi:hypothetical protein